MRSFAILFKSGYPSHHQRKPQPIGEVGEVVDKLPQRSVKSQFALIGDVPSAFHPLANRTANANFIGLADFDRSSRRHRSYREHDEFHNLGSPQSQRLGQGWRPQERGGASQHEIFLPIRQFGSLGKDFPGTKRFMHDPFWTCATMSGKLHAGCRQPFRNIAGIISPNEKERYTALIGAFNVVKR